MHKTAPNPGLAGIARRLGKERRAAVAGQSVPESQHGTRTGYTKGCRCDACRRANRYAGRKYRRKTRHGRQLEHGTVYAYNYFGCRCDLCRQANTDAHREYRARRQASASA